MQVPAITRHGFPAWVVVPASRWLVARLVDFALPHIVDIFRSKLAVVQALRARTPLAAVNLSAGHNQGNANVQVSIRCAACAQQLLIVADVPVHQAVLVQVICREQPQAVKHTLVIERRGQHHPVGLTLRYGGVVVHATVHPQTRRWPGTDVAHIGVLPVLIALLQLGLAVGNVHVTKRVIGRGLRDVFGWHGRLRRWGGRLFRNDKRCGRRRDRLFRGRDGTLGWWCLTCEVGRIWLSKLTVHQHHRQQAPAIAVIAVGVVGVAHGIIRLLGAGLQLSRRLTTVGCRGGRRRPDGRCRIADEIRCRPGVLGLATE